MKHLVTIFLLVASLAYGQSPAMMSDWLRAAKPAGGNDAYVTDWLARVAAAGGAEPSAGTVSALNTFCASLRSYNLDTNMISMTPVVPDNITAAVTPLIKSGGSNSWFRVTFGSSDLTANGLTGGSSKYLRTGVIPSEVFNADLSSAGVTYYVMTNNSGATYDGGSQTNSGLNAFTPYIANGGTAYFDCWNQTAGRVSAANTQSGFVSFNRTATTNVNLYRANSTNTFNSFASKTTATGGALPIRQIFFFSANNYNAAGDVDSGAYSTRTLSFIAIHHGLSSVQASNLYVCVQTLRTSLGGGYR